jgi:S-adenosylmethionine decarboxylase
MTKEPLGHHFLYDYIECSSASINDIDYLESNLESLIRDSGCTIIQKFSHAFSPHGITIMFVLAESHVALHTWPEFSTACLDIFLCNKSHVSNTIALSFQKLIHAKQYTTRTVERG